MSGPVVHLLVLPAHLTHSEPSKDGQPWFPKETFSPSQLSGYTLCQRKWAWRYLGGLREVRKGKGAMLGSLIHACAEHYLRGGTVYDIVAPDGSLRLEDDVFKELQGFTLEEQRAMVEAAPKRALVGIEHLPRLQECEHVEVETWIDIDTRRLNAGIEPLRITGKIDLRVKRSGIWYTYDHKSTKGKRGDPWAYVKPADTLLDDPQGVFYPLDGMLKHGQPSIWSRWLYYQTDPKVHPMAKPIDFEAHFDATKRAANEWLIVAVEMRKLVREAVAGALKPDDLPAPTTLPPHPDSPCLAFGGCPYRAERGGPCRVTSSLNFGSMILQTQGADMSATNLNLAEKLAAARGTNAQNAATMGVPMPPPAAVAPMAPPPPAAAVPMPPPPPVVPPQSDLLPPEAYQAPAAAPPPGLPPLPPGWAYGADGVPRPVQVAPMAPPAPPAAPPPPPAATTPAEPAAAATGAKRGRKSKAEKEAAAAAAALEAPPAPAATVAVNPAGVAFVPEAAPAPEPAGGMRLKLKATFADGTIIEVPCPAELSASVEASILALLG